MSKKKSVMVLGWTRSGLDVLLPTSASPDGETFNGWTRGDHVDAARILAEHSDRDDNHEVRSWCKRWAKIHRAISKSGSAAVDTTIIRAAAETAILSRRRHR